MISASIHTHYEDSGHPLDPLFRLLSPSNTDPGPETMEEWEIVLHYADRMKVIPLLFYMVKQKPEISPPPAIHEKLRSVYLANASRTLVFTYELERILTTLDERGIPAIPLKGAYLTHTVYERPALRQMIDLDILIQWENMDEAIRLLELIGYVPISKPALDAIYREKYHHFPIFLHPSGVRVELHWNITHHRQLGDRATYIEKLFWDSARISDFLSTKAWILPPEILILHGVIHQTVHHVYNNGIREFYDIERIYRTYKGTVNWENLWNIAQEINLQKQLAVTLTLTDRIVGTDLLEEMKRTGYRIEIPKSRINYALTEIMRGKGENKVIAWLSLADPSSREWIRTILTNTFISRELMEEKYSISSGSSLLYVYYLYRVADLLIHQGPGLLRQYIVSRNKNPGNDERQVFSAGKAGRWQ